MYVQDVRLEILFFFPVQKRRNYPINERKLTRTCGSIIGNTVHDVSLNKQISNRSGKKEKGGGENVQERGGGGFFSVYFHSSLVVCQKLQEIYKCNCQ